MFADVALRAPRLSPGAILTMYALQIAFNVVAPWLLLRYFKWRVRCTACGYRWRQPPTHTHAELSRMAADADGTPA